jgi:hypothetical protein
MGAKIPTHFDAGKLFAIGYATPKDDKTPQVMYALPRRVIPIFFCRALWVQICGRVPNVKRS